MLPLVYELLKPLAHFTKWLKETPLMTVTFQLFGIVIPLIYVILGSLWFLFKWYRKDTAHSPIKVDEPYDMCGCHGGSVGIAAQVPITVCPSGYQCYWRVNKFGQCIPISAIPGKNMTC